MSAVTVSAVGEIGEIGESRSPIRALLEQGVQDEVYPGAVLIAGRRGEVQIVENVGKRSNQPESEDAEAISDRPMAREMVFDVAAITGAVVTTTLVMQLVERKALRLSDSVARYFQGFSVLGKSRITVGDLVRQTSGLPVWHPFFEELAHEHAGSRRGILTSRGARDYVFNWINRCGLRHDPGTKQIYSDLNGMILGGIIEMLTGLPLDKAAQRMIFAPLGMRSSSFIDLALIRRRGIHPVTEMIAPTEECSWRKRILCGEVHDDNAWAMGGVSGHSGLFTTADDLHLFATEMIDAYHGRSTFLQRDTLRTFWNEPVDQSGGWRHGWETPNAENEIDEAGLSPSSVGCLGFTGCSLWIDPEREIDIVLMTNRVHPSRANKKIRAFRPQLFKAIVETI